MTTTKNTRSAHQSEDESFGLLANGVSGSWEIAINESTSGAERWFAQIEGASVSFYFEIPSLDTVGKMVRFFGPRAATTKEANGSERNDTLAISIDENNPITLLRDDEYDDRYFLVMGPMEKSVARFVIAGRDAVEIANALRQVKEDLDDQGV